MLEGEDPSPLWQSSSRSRNTWSKSKRWRPEASRVTVKITEEEGVRPADRVKSAKKASCILRHGIRPVDQPPRDLVLGEPSSRRPRFAILFPGFCTSSPGCETLDLDQSALRGRFSWPWSHLHCKFLGFYHPLIWTFLWAVLVLAGDGPVFSIYACHSLTVF